MRVILASIFAVVLGVSVFAQSPTGSIGGIVFDADARTIPGAEIIVVNDLTRVQYETKTNGMGIYAVPNLPPGPYRIQASKAGFKTLIKPDIILNVQDAITVNFTLPIGATSIAVTVEGGAPMINTTDASVSTVVDRQFAENLPLNGRSFQTLIYLTPGIVATPTSVTTNGQFSVNGQRAASNYWMVDGVSANIGISAASNSPGNGLGGAIGSTSALGTTSSLVSVDALQEFRIQTSTFAPEFGRTPGGQISIVTRSGTNQFHGTAFDYVRNDKFDANNWFANSAGLTRPQERQNDFGGTVGGPVWRGKTFFFFSYEGLRLRLPQTRLTGVPDLASRSNASPAMVSYLNAFPLPNGSDNPATGVAHFNASYSDPASLDAYSLRVDHTFNERWNLFARYNYAPSDFSTRGASYGYAALNVVQPFRVVTQTGTAGLSWLGSPNITNDLRFNYSTTVAKSHYYLDSFGGGTPLITLPFPDSYSSANGFFNSFLYALGVGEGLSVGKGAHNRQKQINVVDTLSRQFGAHSLKFGIDFRRLTPDFDPASYDQTVTFNSVAASQAGKSSYGNVALEQGLSLLFRNVGAFAQDTWRASHRLTVTYGIRWDVDVSPASLRGPALPAVTGYSLTNFSNLVIAPAGTPAFHTTFGNFAPRLGLAYQLRETAAWQTVIRGGFGIFYDLVSSEAAGLLTFQFAPIGSSKTFFNATFPFSPTQNLPAPIPPMGTLANVFVFNPNLRLPYTREWNVALEQSLGNNQSLSVSYVGAVGERLLQATVIEKPPTNTAIGQGYFIDNTAASDYNALQVQFKRRLSRGLQVLASYSWAHSTDDASAGFGNGSDQNTPARTRVNWGPSDFDVRHAFTAGITYDLPATRRNAFAKAILNGWSIESLVLARSAPPVNVTDVNFQFLNTGVNTNIRPDVVEGQPLYLYGSQFPGTRALNPNALVDPPVDPTTGNPVRQGTLGRNALRGFGATQWDFSVHRDFPMREWAKLQVRAEMFNVLNHPNFGPPNIEFGVGGFGLATQTLAQSLSSGSLGAGGFDPLYQVGGPRSIQLALKLIF